MFANGTVREMTASLSDCDVWLTHRLDLFSPMSLTTLIGSSRGGQWRVQDPVAVSGLLWMRRDTAFPAELKTYSARFVSRRR